MKKLFDQKVGGLLLSVLLIVVSSFNFISNAQAATGLNKTINFQGKVVNTDGTNVADASYTFVFKIYDSDTGGTSNLLWGGAGGESVSLTTTSGVFQTALGSTRSFATDSLDFNRDDLWLEITFNTKVMSPRIHLTAVPYAMNADKVHGLSVTDTTGTLTIPSAKTISFGDAFTTANAMTFGSGTTGTITIGTSNNNLSIATTGLTSVTLPTSGTLLSTSGSQTVSVTGGNGSVGDTFSLQDNATSGTTTANDLAISLDGKGNVTGQNTINGLNISAVATYTNNIFNAINIPASNNLNNYLVTPNITIDSSGNISGAGNIAGTGTTGLTMTGTGSSILFATGSGTHSISASAGTLQLGAFTLNGAVAGGNQSISNINTLTVGAASTTTGSLVLASSAAAGTSTFQAGNQGGSSITYTLPTAVAGGAGYVLASTTGGVLSWAAPGSSCSSCLIQAPTTTAQNTVTVGNNSGVVGLTVNNSTNSTTADGVDINMVHTANTATNGLLVNMNGSGGTTTNGINITNTAGTLTNGLTLSGTFTKLINSTNFNVTNAGAVTAVGVAAGSGAITGSGGITVTGNTALSATAGNTVAMGNTTGTMVLQSGGTSSWANTSGSLTLSTVTSGALALNSAGALTLTGAAASTWSTSGTSSDLIVRSGSTTANTGLLIDTNAVSGGTGGLTVTTGNASAGASGAHNINTGTGTTGTGLIAIATGASSAGASGAITINTGNATSGASGTLDIASGTTTTSGTTGNVSFKSGAPVTTTLNSGTVTIASGAVGASGTSGNVSLEVGTGGTLGTIQIGNASAAAINIGTVTTTKTIQIGTSGGTAVDVINIGNGTATGGITVNLGNGVANSRVVVGKDYSAVPGANLALNGQIIIGSLSNSAANGRIWIKANGINHTFKSANNSIADYSEYLQQEDTSEPGDVMVLSKRNFESVKKSAQAYDQNVLGVVTQYGTSWNNGNCLDEVSCDHGRDPHWANVGMLGQVYTKISNENGNIQPGDPLATSNVVGVVMKASKTGRIIGYAIDSYDGTHSGQDLFGNPPYPVRTVVIHPPGEPERTVRVGKILILLQAGWYDPDAPPPDINQVAFVDPSGGGQPVYGLRNLATGHEITSQLVKKDAKIANLTTGLTISRQMFTDALEVTGQAKINELEVGTIKPNASHRVVIDIGNQNSQFVIKGSSSQEVFTVDNSGNAVFNGTITASRISANQIDGLSLFTNRLDGIEARVASLEASLNNSSGEGHMNMPVIPTGTASNEAQLTGLLVGGNATVSANLHVGGSGLIEGILNVIGSITTKNLIVGEWADFINHVIFRGDVNFEGRPVFNKDTAGFAVVKKGDKTIDVTFDKEYTQVPVVNINITFDDLSVDLGHEATEGAKLAQQRVEEAVLNGDIRYIVSKKTTKGFTVKINKSSDYDLKFAWSAFAVKDAKTSSTDNQVSPTAIPTTIISPTGSVTPTTTGVPTQTPSPSVVPTTTPPPTPTPSSVPAHTLTILDNDLGFLRVRAEPNDSSAEVGRVNPGGTFPIVDESFGWYRITYSAGSEGWVSGTYVRVNPGR